MIDEAELDVFSYDDDLHQYRNAKQELRPSVTETLKHGGLFNYSRINPETLERKRIVGKNVHAWTARYDRALVEGGDLPDLDELSEEEEGYARGYLKLRESINFEILSIEQPMLRPIAGLEVGGTPDRKIRIGRRIYIADLKCVAAFHAGWRLQLADYVMMDTGRRHCSAYGRVIFRLLKNGTFRFDPIDAKWDDVDSAVATSFVSTFVWKRNHNLL